MTEIKFRAWDKRNKQWIYAELSPTSAGMGSLLQAMVDGRVDQIDRFTGLRDKNDVEIYEGDIVYGLKLSGDEYTTSVKFSDGMFNIADPHEDLYFERDEGLEVIGNIYENPELLEKAS